ncbi:MAG: LamG domain-containing protein [Verrucomicrobia bacterium]|nr:LamG domain-containing protein [Verrucomicrobiota bacterium]
MKHPVTRREFLQRTGATVAAAAVLKLPSRGLAAPNSPAIPPHRALDVPGVHAYPLEHSVAAGDTLELCVSNSVPYRLSICRLGVQVDDPAGDTVLARFDESPANPQPIHPGSYVHIEKHLRGKLSAVTLECWLRPWDITKLAGLISQEDKDSDEGFALGIGKDGYVGFYLGDGVGPDEKTVHRTKPGAVKRNRWHHVVATWDGQRKRVFVDAKEVGAWNFAGPLLPGKHSLRLGAMAQKGIAQHFLDGDLAMPVIYDRALSADEIDERFKQQGLKPARGKGVLACWPLTEERGERVADVSGDGRHGRIINHATWMIGGPSFDANVPRFGNYDPKQDATRGHGLRLASDDLYDCRWKVTHRWKAPADARQGIYVARMEFTFDGRPRTQHCTFIVRRAPRRKKAPILLLLATNTWRAYSGTPFAITPEAQHQVWGTGGIEKDPRGLPAYNLYRDHATGQGTYQVGLRMPWPAAGPYVLYGGPTKYSHLARADRFTQVWLEEQGYYFDVASDLDLHRDPGVLRGYKVFMVVGHNEYWSLPMYRGTDDYLRRGGNLAVLSGNSIFWRVSFNDDGTVMECRKADAAGNRVPLARRGEAWHSHDGRRGGMMRDCGFPGINLIALDCLGFNSPGNIKNFGPYLVEDPGHFLFHTPEKLGLKKGDSFGQSADGARVAGGHEFDIRPSTFARLQEEPSPAGGVVPNDPPGIRLLANGQVFWKNGGTAFDYFFRKIAPKTDQGGELIYWERPAGGRVFNAATIASGWVLAVDPKMSGLLRNVLHHFGATRNRP